MKKIGAIMAAVLCSSVMAIANSGGWKTVSENAVVGETPADILQILETEASSFAWLRQDHLNREIAGVKTDAVSIMNINVKELRWEGETTCVEGDPRLEAKLLSGFIKRVSGSTEGFEDVIANGDPCK